MKALKAIGYILWGAAAVAAFFAVQFVLVMAHAWIAQFGFSLLTGGQ
jgi:hypothetical protein